MSIGTINTLIDGVVFWSEAGSTLVRFNVVIVVHQRNSECGSGVDIKNNIYRFFRITHNETGRHRRRDHLEPERLCFSKRLEFDGATRKRID